MPIKTIVRCLLLATFAAWTGACGGPSSSSTLSTPTAPTPTTPTGSVSTAQATSVATEIGALIVTALRSGSTPLGILSVGTAASLKPQVATGQLYSSMLCPLNGRIDLIYVRNYAPTSGDFDLSALKAVFTGCAFTSNGGPFQISGELAMSGQYFGSAQAPSIHTSGTLTTSSGACAIDGAVAASGSFGGTACGMSLTDTTTAPPSGSFDASGSWAGTTTASKSGGGGTKTFSISAAIQQIGQSITGSGFDPSGGTVVTFGFTQIGSPAQPAGRMSIVRLKRTRSAWLSNKTRRLGLSS